MQFTIGCYKQEHCVICNAHISEIHKDGCELGAAYAEIKDMRLVIKQFLKLLGVETITSAFSKIAAQQSVQATELMCPACQVERQILLRCPKCQSLDAPRA